MNKQTIDYITRDIRPCGLVRVRITGVADDGIRPRELRLYA